MDYRFHTKEQQDFYETVLLDKKPIVCDMRWVDWEFIKENEDHFPGVLDSFKAYMFLVLLLGFGFGAGAAALGAALGFDGAAPDLIASPISFCALGAGATSSSSSSSSEGS